MNFSAFDLNHVRALHYLLEEAHVARAARKLGITPAATSNALRRLRVEFDDPLLVRSGRALARTPLAEGLRGPAREVLAAAERLFEVGAPFEPGTYEGELFVTTSDRVAEVLLPALDRLLAERAPRASLSMRTVTVEVEAFLRDHGGIAVIPDISRARGVRAEALFADDFVCVLRKGHPLTKGPWTVRRFAGAEHILVAPLASSHRGVVDDRLAEQGLARRVTRVVTSFGLAVPLLVASDRIAILPRSFALARARELDLVVRAAPLDLPALEMQMAWHPGHERDPKHVWFRGVLRDAARASGLRLP
ncbi:LysR family transcriptional regulator [Sorangium sp. So ce1153]|uniref:LysR family transcriptional regulator n=1 Tax=Sorangium sp. So ce1153 TaxID=3133333 RepID=UPI003F5F4933